MLQLDNITTEPDYTDENTISDQQADLLDLSVATADVYVRLRPYDADRQNELPFGDEFRIVAPTQKLFEATAGIEVRSATGTPATVTAQLFEPDDPRPSSGTAATVVTTLAQVGVQHNETIVASEPTLDFDDTATVAFTITDDLANSRAKIAAAIPSSVNLPGAPTAATAATSTSTTQIATTAYVIGQAAVAAPLMDGSSAVGSSTLFARQDHVHPTDTTRAPLASPAFTGTPTAPTPLTSDNSTNIATTAYVQAQGYVTSVPVTKVFGRTGAVVATAGDYTAAQVTNAADKSSSSSQVFTGTITAPRFAPQIVAASQSGGTYNPAVSADSFFSVTTTAANLTIGSPFGTPGPGFSQRIVIEIRNSSGATFTPGFNAIFRGQVASSIPNGSGFAYSFDWNGDAWVCTGTSSSTYSP